METVPATTSLRNMLNWRPCADFAAMMRRIWGTLTIAAPPMMPADCAGGKGRGIDVAESRV